MYSHKKITTLGLRRTGHLRNRRLTVTLTRNLKRSLFNMQENENLTPEHDDVHDSHDHHQEGFIRKYIFSLESQDDR